LDEKPGTRLVFLFARCPLSRACRRPPGEQLLERDAALVGEPVHAADRNVDRLVFVHAARLLVDATSAVPRKRDTGQSRVPAPPASRTGTICAVISASNCSIFGPGIVLKP
jgi:hypothetical protein